MRRLSKSALCYARNPQVRLRSVNRKRAKAGKPLLSSPDEIGRDFMARHVGRPRDDRGRWL